MIEFVCRGSGPNKDIECSEVCRFVDRLWLPDAEPGSDIEPEDLEYLETLKPPTGCPLGYPDSVTNWTLSERVPMDFIRVSEGAYIYTCPKCGFRGGHRCSFYIWSAYGKDIEDKINTGLVKYIHPGLDIPLSNLVQIVGYDGPVEERVEIDIVSLTKSIFGGVS